MFKSVCVLVCLSFVVLSGYVMAQDSGLTCDNGENDVLNAAQAAFDAQDYQTALDLVTQAETLCANNAVRYIQAQRLHSDIDIVLDRIERETFVTNAVPGSVNVGDYSLFMACLGEGTPTVIFENGFGVTLDTWTEVQPVIAEDTRACVYDRLGLGLSDPIPSDGLRTIQDQVDDLHLLLEMAEIEGPYILVGHSIGGFNILLFADQHREELAGLVFVDAAHPDQETRFRELNPDSEPIPPGIEQFDSLASIEQLTSVEKDFGDIPLVVLTAEFDPDEDIDRIIKELHEDYTTYSTNSQHIVTDRSGHFIQLDYPDLVVESIRWILAGADPSTIILEP